MLCCVGCATCALNVKPDPDVEETDQDVVIPEDVVRVGGSYIEPSSNYNINRDSVL